MADSSIAENIAFGLPSHQIIVVDGCRTSPIARFIEQPVQQRWAAGFGSAAVSGNASVLHVLSTAGPGAGV